jgi:hypothetical protein
MSSMPMPLAEIAAVSSARSSAISTRRPVMNFQLWLD